MSVVVVGLNHRTVPLEILEPMTVSADNMGKALADLIGRDDLSEAVVLSTCMRTEIYVVAHRFHSAMSDLRNFLSAWSGSPPEFFSDHLYSYYDEGAVRHLFRVAGGVDSAVLGEGEILAQVRRSADRAREEGAAGPVLGLLFRQAVEAGKRVRSETRIARGTTSLAHAALTMVVDRLGGLADRTVLLIGAGEMGETTAMGLGAMPAPGRVLVANRTAARADALAARCGGTTVAWEDLDATLATVDVVMSATGSPDTVIGAAELEAARAGTDAAPLLIVDMAVPRDADPGVRSLPGVTLLDMDDLKAYAGRAMAARRAEVPVAEAILDEEVDRYREVAAHREVAPLVAALHARAEAVRAAELDRFGVRLAGLDPAQRRAVEGLTRGILAKLLHEPTVVVKTEAGRPGGEVVARSLRQLFDL